MNPKTTARHDSLVFISAFAPGDAGAIHAFYFDTNSGGMQAVHRTVDIQHPFFLATSPDHRFLYAIKAEEFGGEQDEFVAAYKIERGTGELRKLNQQSTAGTGSCYLHVDATGQSVVAANYTSGSVVAFPVLNDGALGPAGSFVRHYGPSIDSDRQAGPHAHCILTSPDSRFALAADLGLDKVLVYQFDASAARLVPHARQESLTMAPGSGPRHLAFHPHGGHVYVINELQNTVTLLDMAPESGTLTERQTISTLPKDFRGTSYCADVQSTPDGRFLYGTNRGHDSIVIYRIGRDGQLAMVDLQPSLGQGPQNLLITPDGRWLLCANMPGNSVVVFRIQADSGRLQAIGEPVAIPMPSCIRWLA